MSILPSTSGLRQYKGVLLFMEMFDMIYTLFGLEWRPDGGQRLPPSGATILVVGHSIPDGVGGLLRGPHQQAAVEVDAVSFCVAGRGDVIGAQPFDNEERLLLLGACGVVAQFVGGGTNDPQTGTIVPEIVGGGKAQDDVTGANVVVGDHQADGGVLGLAHDSDHRGPGGNDMFDDAIGVVGSGTQRKGHANFTIVQADGATSRNASGHDAVWYMGLAAANGGFVMIVLMGVGVDIAAGNILLVGINRADEGIFGYFMVDVGFKFHDRTSCFYTGG